MNIVMLHDAVSSDSSADERDVFVQMEAIAAALADLGHESSQLPCTLDLNAAARSLRQVGPDLVFNLVESLGGQGRLIHLAPSLLDSLGMAFTGCPTDAIYATSNKLLAKRLLAGAGIATPVWFSSNELARGASVPPGRYIIKSVWEHASRGLDEDSVIESDDGRELLDELRMRSDSLGGEGFCEAYIDGREFNLSILGGASTPSSHDQAQRIVLPPAEISFDGYAPDKLRVVGYRAKWDEDSFEFQNTPRQFDFESGDTPLLWELERMALSSWDLFNLRGFARVDFRVDETGKPWVLEINTNPCLSPDAGFAAAVSRAGLGFNQAIARILADT